jgi:alpha-glucosidase
VEQSTEEKPNGALRLRVYPGDDCRGSLYQDDGHTFAYQKGEILRVNYSCEVSQGGVTVTSRVEQNGYQPWWNCVEVTLYGAVAPPKEVHVGDQIILKWRYDGQAHTVAFTLPGAVGSWTAHLTF